MSTILKFFFYSIALFSLVWVRETPAEAVTWIEWVRLVQAQSTPNIVLLITACLWLMNFVLTGSLQTASRVYANAIDATNKPKDAMEQPQH
jgi:hypothetical protein